MGIKMALLRYEKETCMSWNEEEDTVSIYTASLSEKRKLEKKGFKLSGSKRKKWEFTAPKSDFRYGLKRKRKLTALQREALSQRMKDNIHSKNHSHDKLS